ncbi:MULTISPECIES: response regulator transcription factor [Acinetobacter]|uniref:response regulator transcription factor n=1 Tax=Acinetobacter TaxID=469 RepID=UPI0015D1FCE4|nr:MULTISPECIES: response regulator [Acinetobacter]MCL6233850.1 response regulator [Acinetobacter amyesii]QOW51500.1 response regulator transcription factor [Acinetobacter sp. YH12138]UIJ77554.1 response regulator [Acinetobacter sp. SH20PTE14]
MYLTNSHVPEPIVYVIDDDQDICNSLTWLLDSVQLETKTFNSATEFLNFQRPQTPACLILDIRMRGMSGLQLQQQLNQQKIRMPIIFMTGHGDIPMSVNAMKAGAFDFLEKPFNPQHMLNQIQACLQLAEQDFIEEEKRQEQMIKLKSLSPRESEIINLLVDGLSSKHIAQMLNISHKTVEIHRTHIRQKLGTESIAQIVNMVLMCRDKTIQAMG